MIGLLLVLAVGATPDAPLTVAVAGSPPFVVPNEGRLGGLSVDLWEKVSAKANLPFTLVEVDNVAQAIGMVHRGEAQAAVGPISITAARTASVSFTQPYFRSETGILTNAKGPGLWDRIRPFISTAFFVGVGFLLLVLTSVGALIWGMEHRANPDEFPDTLVRGIGAGIWLALVTMTTVGYGDKAPRTIGGRVLVGVWMVISMITASSLTASIATALTLANLERAEITGLASLDQKAVAVMRGTTAVDVARSVGARLVVADDLPGTIDAVLDRRAVATVSDLPILQYQASQHPEWPVVVIPSEERVERYGFVFAHGSEHLLDANIALLELIETGEVDAIRRRWLGR